MTIEAAIKTLIGVFIATVLEGGKIKKSLPVLIGCCIGGILAGIILTVL